MDTLIKEIIVQLIGFVIFFVILKAAAWKPILGLLAERRNKIAKGFDDIEKGKLGLEQLQKDYQARLAKIEDEARLKLNEAVSEGKKIAQEIREKGREEANEILLKAKESVAQEIAKAEASLRKRTVDIAMAASEHLLRKQMNAAEQRALVADFIDRVSAEVKK